MTVHRVGDIVRQVHDLGLQASPARGRALPHPREGGRVVGIDRVLARRLGQVRAARLHPRILADRVQGRARQVQAGRHASRTDHLGFQARHHAQCLRVSLEPPDGGCRRIQGTLAVVPEGRVSQVVRQARRVHHVGVRPQLLAQLTPHLGDLEGVGEARAHEIVRNGPQHLSLLPQAAQRRGVQDSSTVSLELRAFGRLVVLRHPPLRIGMCVRHRPRRRRGWQEKTQSPAHFTLRAPDGPTAARRADIMDTRGLVEQGARHPRAAHPNRPSKRRRRS